MQRGRPTKYNDEMPDRLRKAGQEAVAKGDLPTLAKASLELGVDRDTLKEWNKKHRIFSAAYKEFKELQEETLVQGGLKNKYHGSFAIFTAKNVLGWRDKQDITTDGKELPQPILGNYDNTRKLSGGDEEIGS